MKSIENKLAKIEVFITDIDGSVKKDRVRTKVVDGKLEIIRSHFNEELIEAILRIKKKGIQFGVASGWGFDAIQYYFKNRLM